MIRKITLFIFSITFVLQAFAGGVKENVAVKVAQAFLHSRLKQAPASPLELTTASVKPVGEIKTLFYAVDFSRGGYVLVSATDAAMPVLGYSFEGEFTLNEQSPSFLAWMQGYQLQLNEIVENEIAATQEITTAWDELMNYVPSKNTSGSGRSIEPLLPCTWNQGALYNDLCPEDAGGPGGHVYSGCVATAMSQVIYYWRYPLQGSGSHGYYSDYGYLFVDFSQADYNYEEMRNSIGNENNYEMAEIQYHCGVAVDMMYSPSGSGAYSDDAAAALRNYFGYSDELNLEYKDDYSESDWAALLMQNLDNGWPMYYHGFGSGGHAFNVDGYQGTDFFHFNWGWGGSANGYFYLNNLNPNGSNFTYGQGAIVNFVPGDNYPYYCTGTKTLTRHNGTIEDGSGPIANYTSGLSCGWLIAPADSVTNLTVNFEKFGLTAGVDVLNVYDGADASAPLLGSFTGNSLPPSVTASRDRLFIEFLTDGDEGSGFRLSYNSELAVYCSGQTILNEPDGVIADGSGTRDYNNNSVCKFRVEPADAESITFTFNYLNTEPVNDAVKIYNLATQSMIGNFSGTDNPGSITVPSGKALILFTTNGDVTGEGWEVSYTSSTTAVDNSYTTEAGALNVSIHPMPVKEWMRIEMTQGNSSAVKLGVYDLSGRLILEQEVAPFSGSKTEIIPAEMLANGIYFLRFTSENGSGSQKLVVKN